jgi:hypothetical protein
MGPGPWPLRLNVEVAGTNGSLHPTNMNRKGNITINHVLKIIIRVEKGGVGDVDGSKKKKVYDIVIQYPIHLLSVRIHIAWCIVILKADERFTVSLQPEVYLATAVHTNAVLRSDAAWPIIAIRTRSFEHRTRSIRG